MNQDVVVYPAIFDFAADGISISFPDLPGCFSCADTQEDALAMARDALGCWVAATKEDLGKPIPAPSDIKAIALEPNQSIVMVDAWMPLYFEKQRAGSVKKSVTVPVWLNELAESAQLNFSQVLQAGLKATLGIQNQP